MLQKFQANGIKCAVGSSGCLENVNFVLRECHIAPYFQAIVAGDMVTHCKPDPEIYLTAAAKLGLDPSECMVFEDAMVGIEAGKAAGVDHVIALTTSYPIPDLKAAGPEFIIDDFTDVTDQMLQRLR